MSERAQTPETISDTVAALRHAADVLESCQRCKNHLEALLAVWDEVEDADRFAMLVVAADRIGARISADHRTRALDEIAL